MAHEALSVLDRQSRHRAARGERVPEDLPRLPLRDLRSVIGPVERRVRGVRVYRLSLSEKDRLGYLRPDLPDLERFLEDRLENRVKRDLPPDVRLAARCMDDARPQIHVPVESARISSRSIPVLIAHRTGRWSQPGHWASIERSSFSIRYSVRLAGSEGLDTRSGSAEFSLTSRRAFAHRKSVPSATRSFLTVEGPRRLPRVLLTASRARLKASTSATVIAEAGFSPKCAFHAFARCS